MFRVKETAKLPISEDFFPTAWGGGEPRSELHPPTSTLQRVCPPCPHEHLSLPSRPSAEGRPSRETAPLFYTFGPKSAPNPTPRPRALFCKYVKKKNMQTLEPWLEPPAAALSCVIVYRESRCSETVWLCDFCTFAIRNIKDLFSYFKPGSPPFSCVSGDFGDSDLRACIVLYQGTPALGFPPLALADRGAP